MTDDELEIVNRLGEIWNLFCDLPTEHPNEAEEFCTKLHDLQHQIMARPTRRWLQARGLASGT